MAETKDLIVVSQPEFNPQYGGRTLIEKVATAKKEIVYMVSDGEMIKNKKEAVKRQLQLDFEDRIFLFISGSRFVKYNKLFEYVQLLRLLHYCDND